MLAKLLLLLAAVNAPCGPCRYSQAGVELTQHFEGYSPFVYEDVAGERTIGFGHLVIEGEYFEEPLLPHEATELLKRDLAVAERGVNRHVRVRLNQGQFDALTDFTFNLGTGALRSSTLLRVVNAELHDAVPGQLMRWNKARVNGRLQPVRGLTRRREAEVEFYNAGFDMD